MKADQTITPDWIGLDWGDTTLHAYAMSAQGQVLAERDFDQRVFNLSTDAFIHSLISQLEGWTVARSCRILACGPLPGAEHDGQISSYRSVPCAPLAETLPPPHIGDQTPTLWSIPGLKQDSPPDIMHGAETRIAGFLALNPDWDGVICLLGAHSTWVHISAGEIVSFQTFLTGELFAAISEHTALRHALGGDAWDTDAFTATMSTLFSRPERLASTLFSVRANSLLHSQEPSIARAQLLGALIGAELAAAKPYWLGQNIALIGDARQSELYGFALKQQGVTAQQCDAKSATIAGLSAAYLSHLSEPRS